MTRLAQLAFSCNAAAVTYMACNCFHKLKSKEQPRCGRPRCVPADRAGNSETHQDLNNNRPGFWPRWKFLWYIVGLTGQTARAIVAGDWLDGDAAHATKNSYLNRHWCVLGSLPRRRCNEFVSPGVGVSLFSTRLVGNQPLRRYSTLTSSLTI